MMISLTRAILLLLAAVEEKAADFFLENTKERKFGVLFSCLVFQAGDSEFKEMSVDLEQYRTAHILRLNLNDQNFVEDAC